MIHEDVSTYYDDPDNARSMCSMLTHARPGWTVWRENRRWRARHASWPEDRPAWESWNAGLLNEQMAAHDAAAAT